MISAIQWQEATRNVCIRDWYHEMFPTDNLWVEIDPTATMEGLFYALWNGEDVYEYIGEGDSLIRERCFFKLCELMEVSYDYIYDMWVRG